MTEDTRTLPPAIMLQGTCSNAGKSLIAMALCRIFKRAGYTVVPFKAQNMSLNSFVTATGEEMGRAQALQAEACGCAPDARMNPILLKPIRDRGSQLIVLGKPEGMLTSADFARFRKDLWDVVCTSYRALAKEASVVILEGAGSPAEINLKKHDIVNMRMAHFANASVFLTADIDRGGAFAALVGTMQLLEEEDRARVTGYLLNKFRGDPSLLTPALETVQTLTQRPFLGIIPWIDGLNLPDEDSVSLQAGEHFLHKNRVHASKNTLDIAMLRLPHMSNTTDIDALCCEDDIALRLIDTPETFGVPDLLILPGSRNTTSDRAFLTAQGLDECILRYSARCQNNARGRIIGICGGLQLLSTTLQDPLGLEETGTHAGLGILPLVTIYAEKKQLRQVKAHTVAELLNPTCTVVGYEIHHGISHPITAEVLPVLTTDDGRDLGYGIKDAQGTIRIFGTYLHGIFDDNAFRSHLLNSIRAEKGLPIRPQTTYDRNQGIDRVADIVQDILPLRLLCEKAGIRNVKP